MVHGWVTAETLNVLSVAVRDDAAKERIRKRLHDVLPDIIGGVPTTEASNASTGVDQFMDKCIPQEASMLTFHLTRFIVGLGRPLTSFVLHSSSTSSDACDPLFLDAFRSVARLCRGGGSTFWTLTLLSA